MTASRPGGPARCALLLALAASCGCVSAPPLVEGTVPVHSIGSDSSALISALGPGDLLSVTVVGHPDVTRPDVPLRIDPQGYLNLPVIGSIELAGLTVGEGRERIETELARYLVEPQVGLTVTEFAARQAFVLGEVKLPGAYVLDRPTTALQLLAKAGGALNGGDRENVAVIRENDGELEVHFFDAATPDATGLVAIHPGDLVFVRLSRGGAFKEQLVPVLQAAAPIIGALTNLIVVSEALED